MKLGQRNIFLKILLFTIIFASASAQTIDLKDPQSISDGTIMLSWTIDSEAGVDHYEIFRSTSKDAVFTQVGVRKCGEFEFRDTGLFKSTIKYFCYKVVAVNTDGTRSESVVKGTLYNDGTSSTAKRTWGSIKAMFR